MKPLGRKRPAQPDQRCGIFDNGLIRSINIYLDASLTKFYK